MAFCRSQRLSANAVARKPQTNKSRFLVGPRRTRDDNESANRNKNVKLRKLSVMRNEESDD